MPASHPETSSRRVALIAGSRGLGGAVARKLAGSGWALALAFRRNATAAKALRAALLGAGAPCTLTRCDLADPRAAQRWVADTAARWGRIDALIHAAGSFQRVPLLAQSSRDWLQSFDDNLHSLYFVSRAAAPWMQRQGWGRIVSFAVANADQATGQTHVTAHAIAKLGVLVLTRSLARLLAPRGITVNAISPGFVDSGGLDAEALAELAPRIPAGRLGRLEDVTGVVEFLLSDAAAYVNGANIQVSGGWGV